MIPVRDLNSIVDRACLMVISSRRSHKDRFYAARELNILQLPSLIAGKPRIETSQSIEGIKRAGPGRITLIEPRR
jgi:hypothetical protein